MTALTYYNICLKSVCGLLVPVKNNPELRGVRVWMRRYEKVDRQERNRCNVNTTSRNKVAKLRIHIGSCLYQLYDEMKRSHVLERPPDVSPEA